MRTIHYSPTQQSLASEHDSFMRSFSFRLAGVSGESGFSEGGPGCCPNLDLQEALRLAGSIFDGLTFSQSGQIR